MSNDIGHKLRMLDFIGIIGVTIYAFFHNRMMAYVENCIYGGKWDKYKDSDN